MRRRRLIGLVFMACLLAAVQVPPAYPAGRRPKERKEGGMEQASPGSSEKVVRSEEEWRRLLTPEQFRICRQKGTERAFTGEYWHSKENGVYRCVACGNELFSSETKFDSGTGWPSFWAPVAPDKVQTELDVSLFMRRVEVHCSRCGSHLGHIFDDGPAPTGKRYCINSVSLKLEKR